MLSESEVEYSDEEEEILNDLDYDFNNDLYENNASESVSDSEDGTSEISQYEHNDEGCDTESYNSYSDVPKCWKCKLEK